MSRRSLTRLGALLLPLVLGLTLVACDDQEEAREDPRGALSDAVTALGDYDGVAVTIGIELDEAAEASAMEEGELSESELALLTDSSLTVRAVGGGDDEAGQSEFDLVVGDETVLQVRALGDYDLYALIDLPAVERVAESLDAGPGFQEGLNQAESMAGMLGLGEVASAARDAEWIHVLGIEQLAQMAEEQLPDEAEQPDEADVEAMARDMAQRLLAFFEDEEVEVAHVGEDDAGERIRITADGTELRELAVDLLDSLEEAGDVTGAAGMGMGADELRTELEAAIPEDAEFSLDAWIDGGELSQVAVDVFGLARSAGEEDVPDGEFLVAVALEEFSGPVEAPETDVTFDLFEVFGEMFGGLGDLGDGPLGGEGTPGDAEGPPDDGSLGEDACVSEEEVEQLLQQMPEEQRDLDDDEIEEMLGLPVC